MIQFLSNDLGITMPTWGDDLNHPGQVPRQVRSQAPPQVQLPPAMPPTQARANQLCICKAAKTLGFTLIYCPKSRYLYHRNSNTIVFKDARTSKGPMKCTNFQHGELLWVSWSRRHKQLEPRLWWDAVTTWGSYFRRRCLGVLGPLGLSLFWDTLGTARLAQKTYCVILILVQLWILCEISDLISSWQSSIAGDA